MKEENKHKPLRIKHNLVVQVILLYKNKNQRTKEHIK